MTSRRPDGYHDLETLFYPVGELDGTAGTSGRPFCDILDMTTLPATAAADEMQLEGRPVDCPQEKNLVWRALKLFRSEYEDVVGDKAPHFHITMLKNLPDGAGLGGGSADASFTLRSLNALSGTPFSDERLEEMALRLGADCPFFIRNRAAYAAGVGEKLEDSPLSLAGWWIVIAKPSLHVSTRDAFCGISPAPAPMDLRQVASIPVERWRETGVSNQFETTLFPLYPELKSVKESLYSSKAVYASMSGSGAALYGLYPDREAAQTAIAKLPQTLEGVWLLELK